MKSESISYLENLKPEELKIADSLPYCWIPQEGPQSLAINQDLIDEIFYGGAVGGGKSDYLLGDFGQDIGRYGSAWRGILFRQTYPELEELIARSMEIYPLWFPGSEYLSSDKTWKFPGGETLKMRFLENINDWRRYWGHQYTWIGWDELPNWTNLTPYHKMKARLRSASSIPNKRIRSTGNPGGPSHHEVKTYFQIDTYPMGGHLVEDELTKTTRMFIRSKLQDNKILMQNDPGYVTRLQGLGSKELVRAWLDGDWNVVQGAFFDCWNTEKHVVDPVRLPDHWYRFRACDWGSARPFSVGWYAVSDGELPQFPRGALIKYREWYGMTEGQPNVGLKLTAEEVADGILERENEKISMGVIDPSAFAVDGGPSIAERMQGRGVFWWRADNKRVAQKGAMGGWDQLRYRLKGEGDGPLIYFFSTCIHTIRTLPALQHDLTRPEDLDTNAEDHAADETRYACMSRPIIKDADNPENARWEQDRTFQEMLNIVKKRRLSDD